MSKLQTWTSVSAEVAKWAQENKVASSKAESLLELLESMLAPKVSSSQHPPKEIDGRMYYFCRFHQTYYEQDKMVMSNGKSKGYCKAAIAKWNKTNTEIKKLNADAVEALANGDVEKAKKITAQAQKLSAVFNKPEFYNAEEDWANFKA